MLLCLDVGNSQVFGGIFHDHELQVQFRRTSQTNSSSDELGVFFRSVLRENNVEPDLISKVAICCVVPDLLYSLRACCQKYFGLDPLILRPGIKTGLKIQYRDPKEVGADRIADAVGAIKMFPENLKSSVRCPAMALSKVDFPHPLGPIKVKTSWSLTSNETGLKRALFSLSRMTRFVS